MHKRRSTKVPILTNVKLKQKTKETIYVSKVSIVHLYPQNEINEREDNNDRNRNVPKTWF